MIVPDSEIAGMRLMVQDFEDAAKNEKPSLTASDIFDLVWSELVQILGSSSTAALLRRSAKAWVEQYPELQELVITRTNFDYSYIVPNAWKFSNDSKALRVLLQELTSLLTELTGPVVVQRLKAVPGLAVYDFSSPENHA